MKENKLPLPLEDINLHSSQKQGNLSDAGINLYPKVEPLFEIDNNAQEITKILL